MSPKTKAKMLGTFSASWSVSWPESTAVKNFDIGPEISGILMSAKAISIQL